MITDRKALVRIMERYHLPLCNNACDENTVDGVYFRTVNDKIFNGAGIIVSGFEEEVFLRHCGDSVLMARQFSIAACFFELQLLIYDVRKNGIPQEIYVDESDCRGEDYYKNALRLFVHPIKTIECLRKSARLADEIIPLKGRSYLDSLSVDGKSTLNGSYIDDDNLIEYKDGSIFLYYRERGGSRLEIEFLDCQYLYEYLLNQLVKVV